VVTPSRTVQGRLHLFTTFPAIRIRPISRIT
jgi:hypothetical protein